MTSEKPSNHSSSRDAASVDMPPETEKEKREDSAEVPSDAATESNTVPDARQWPWLDMRPAILAQGLGFGVIFGFLLQKGGVAKLDILVGVLLLENFVVVQVMLSAIIVGMVGVFFLQRMGVLETQIKETVLGPNIIGGLIFGVGFGLLAYCPGTNAAALGQGNLDAIIGIVGMILGSYLFALGSKYTNKTVGRWGRLGKITIANLARQKPGPFIAMFLPWLIVVLLILELIAGR